MPDPRSSLCPRCYRPVTSTTPRVLTADAAYHRRCYLRVRQPRPDPVRLLAVPPRSGGAATADDRRPAILERLAQILVVVLLIATGLILLEHALR